MTAHKHFKQFVRTRMEKTGESYASARRQIVSQTSEEKNGIPWHFSGNVAATTALRCLLTHAGIRDPRTKQPFNEAMLYGIAGGIGIGLFCFYYEKADFASFFIGGRHFWHDDLAYLKNALERFGVKAIVMESSGAKAGEKALRKALETGPCVAWVDAASLPHRTMLAPCAVGAAYHLVSVYSIDEKTGTALIGDLVDEPISISLGDLAAARARIKKDKHRVLSISKADSTVDLAALIKQGLAACFRGLQGEGAVKSAKANFTLEVLNRWADRLQGSKDKDSWERIFGAGPRFLAGLKMVNDFIEHYGGSGLGRPMFAQFLAQAADALKDPSLRDLAKKYAALGEAWTELAGAALPDDVPLFRECKELQAKKVKLRRSGASPQQIRKVWNDLSDIDQQAKAKFPLSPSECADLRIKLQKQVRSLYEEEVVAHEAIGRWLA